ncbi:hypothetical protein [Variovorax sp. tm]|uniref:hypothetical protein n=1 Tax=Variovorax atrisoli TaxID=3394203 RepID=UPI003A7FCECA
MKTWAFIGMLAASLNAGAQVACTMPNGRTITLSLTHTCPAGAVGAKSLDGQPVQIAQPIPSAPQGPPAKPSPAVAAPAASAKPTVRADGSHIVSRGSSAGCASKEAYEQLTKIAVQGDKEAFTKALAAGVLSGQCVIFKRGQVVFIDDTSIFSGLVRLRPQGQVQAYWTAMETISTN